MYKIISNMNAIEVYAKHGTRYLSFEKNIPFYSVQRSANVNCREVNTQLKLKGSN